eukprot:COSAG06_NODE_42724_length_379_cov_0.725000_1_plen_80_part_10
MRFDSQGDGYKNTTFLNNISYFTDVDSELDGGTAMLTGSHLTDTVWIMHAHSIASMIATCHVVARPSVPSLPRRVQDSNR